MSYISRKQTEDAIRKYADQKYSNGEQIEYVNGILKSISVINEQPAADVTEIRHGTWIKEKEYENGKIDYRCSACDYDDTFAETMLVFHKYCNYCGAIMDGGKK